MSFEIRQEDIPSSRRQYAATLEKQNRMSQKTMEMRELFGDVQAKVLFLLQHAPIAVFQLSKAKARAA